MIICKCLENDFGASRMFGGSGNDVLSARTSDQDVEHGVALFGGSGNDRIDGASNEDTIKGGSGHDDLDGGDGDDVILGGKGADLIRGGGGEDVIRGGAGSDTLYGDYFNVNDMLRDRNLWRRRQRYVLFR